MTLVRAERPHPLSPSPRAGEILEAAAAVFVEKGFHPTTTRDIAARAGISEGTIYNYFPNKQALLLGIFERMRAAIIQEALPPMVAAPDVRTFIRTSLQHPLMALKADNFALFRIIVSEMMVNEDIRTLYYTQILEPTLALAEASFQDLAAQHGLSPAAARLTIRAISSMVLGLMMEYIMGDATVAAHWEDLPEFLTELISNGLPGRTG